MSVMVQSHAIELALTDSVTRVQIAITDANGRAVDPKELKLNVTDPSGRVLFTDVLYPGDGEVADPLPSRITRSGRGIYYFPYGADNACGYPAVFFGKLPASEPFDISVNNKLKVSLDYKAYVTITLTAADPTQATALEIVKSINTALVAAAGYGALYSRVARYRDGQLFLVSPQTKDISTRSQVKIDQTVANDATTVLFGVVPSTIQVTGSSYDSEVQTLLNNRTHCTGDALFHWSITAGAGLGSVQVIQVVKVASPSSFAILPYFRTEIDKALKPIGQDLARVGYTDAQLMGFLALAVTEINAYQPITNLSLDNFPVRDFQMILIWTATLIALMSQGLFAIDTDIEYSDRGASFRNDHASKLQSYIQMVTARLEARMQQFKLQFAGVGTVKIEAGANFRLAQVLQASPQGSLFRGLFTR